MKKILMLKGLPGSGKSTYARILLNSNPGLYKRVNKDDLRAMIDDGRWSSKNEKFILKVRDNMIIEALEGNKAVIVDDTNLDPKHETTLRKIAEENGAVFDIAFIDVDVEECIRRDSIRGEKSVGHKVIRGMYNKYLRREIAKLEYDESLDDCIICDIDNTLAIMKDRSPFEWKKVGNDLVNEHVKNIVNNRQKKGEKSCYLILFSGRDECCRKETEDWLYDNHIAYDYLYMRPEGSNEDDRIIKRQMYDEYVKDKYNVLFVLDDRLKVCRMWHEMGLPLLRVGDPDADF